MTTYHVAGWSVNFENTRSRRVELLRWVPIPNTHDGEKYTRLIGRKDGAILFAAWILILQVASKCHPRGRLCEATAPRLTPRLWRPKPAPRPLGLSPRFPTSLKSDGCLRKSMSSRSYHLRGRRVTLKGHPRDRQVAKE